MTYHGYSLSTRHLDGCEQEVALVRFRGSISSSDYEHFQRDLDVVVRNNRFIAADFSSVTYISSASLGLLADVFLQNQQQKGAFCICCLQADPLRVCKITGLGEIIPVFSELEQALLFLSDLMRGVISSEWDFSRNLDRSLLQLDLVTSSGLEKLHTIIVSDENQLITFIMRNRLNIPSNHTVCAPSCAQVKELLKLSQQDLLVIDSEHLEYDAIIRAVNEAEHQPMLSVISLSGCSDKAVEQRLELAMRELFPGCGGLSELTPAQQQQLVMSQPLFSRQAEMSLHSDEISRHTAEMVCRKLSLICGLSGEKADNFFFAVREAIDNACHHGNRLDPRKQVHLCFVRFDDRVEMTVTDEGEGFDYAGWQKKISDKNPILQANEQKMKGLTGGLGIMLIERCCDGLRFTPPGNSLTITERL